MPDLLVLALAPAFGVPDDRRFTTAATHGLALLFRYLENWHNYTMWSFRYSGITHAARDQRLLALVDDWVDQAEGARASLAITLKQ